MNRRLLVKDRIIFAFGGAGVSFDITLDFGNEGTPTAKIAVEKATGH